MAIIGSSSIASRYDLEYATKYVNVNNVILIFIGLFPQIFNKWALTSF